jgi:hypothetical protein
VSIDKKELYNFITYLWAFYQAIHNENEDSGEEVFTTTSNKFKINKLLQLSDITDFDELDLLSRY